jgi:hypothetical protein
MRGVSDAAATDGGRHRIRCLVHSIAGLQRAFCTGEPGLWWRLDWARERGATTVMAAGVAGSGRPATADMGGSSSAVGNRRVGKRQIDELVASGTPLGSQSLADVGCSVDAMWKRTPLSIYCVTSAYTSAKHKSKHNNHSPIIRHERSMHEHVRRCAQLRLSSNACERQARR